MPEFIGKGLGADLPGSAIAIAGSHERKRLWVHTNTLDHPSVLPLYQRFGFVPHKPEDLVIPDPRVNALSP